MLIIVMYGQLRVGKQSMLTPDQIKQGQKIHYLKIADMLGFQNMSEQTGAFMEEKWKFDVYADLDSIVGIFPFGEFKIESRRQPLGMFKLTELATQKAYETSFYNIKGIKPNPSIKFHHSPLLQKKIRDFFLKNEIFRTFLNGMDKRDERVFIVDIKAKQFNAGERVVNERTKDRALLIVMSGQFVAMDEQSYPDRGNVYKTGALLGIDQFLNDEFWPCNLICE